MFVCVCVAKMLRYIGREFAGVDGAPSITILYYSLL